MSTENQAPRGSESRSVPHQCAGQRLDRTLAELWPSISRTRWKSAILSGRIEVNGEVVRRPNEPVEAGDRVQAHVPQAVVASAPDGAPIRELSVLYEDEELVVVDKPAGLIVHANDRFQTGTLADLVMERYGVLPAVQGAHRRGIVHRLDRLTSGVLLIGRTERAQQSLKEQFQARTVQKSYLAFVHGKPRFQTDWIQASIAPDPRHMGRYRIAPVDKFDGEREVEVEGVREAATYYEVLQRYRGFAELLCQPKTGRTHQIRVHLTSIGMPIIGDAIYRHPGALPIPLPKEIPAPNRHALHAARIEFEHPATGERVHFEAPLPEDLLALRRGLHEFASPE